MCSVSYPFSSRYTPECRAHIGRYACIHGTAAASTYFSRKLKKNITKSTVQSIEEVYSREKRTCDPEDEMIMSALHPMKRGRPLLLGETLDHQVQVYLKKIREQSGIVTAAVVVAAAKGIIMATDKSKLVEFGGHINPNKDWAYHLLKRMNFARRKVTTSKSKMLAFRF